MNRRPSHAEFKREALLKANIRREYDSLSDEYAFIEQLIHARKAAKKSQIEVAKAMDTTTSVISRLESGGGQKRHSPSVDTLQRYARAIGYKVQIKLIPLRKKHA